MTGATPVTLQVPALTRPTTSAPAVGDTLRGSMDDTGDRDRARAPALSLRTTAGTLELGGRPWLMGVVNATPDSFSDDRGQRTLEDRVELARTPADAGADIIDIGGESGVTN